MLRFYSVSSIINHFAGLFFFEMIGLIKFVIFEITWVATLANLGFTSRGGVNCPLAEFLAATCPQLLFKILKEIGLLLTPELIRIQ